MKNFDNNFARLLSTWNHHQDLRSAKASIPDLAASYFDLDVARRMFH